MFIEQINSTAHILKQQASNPALVPRNNVEKVNKRIGDKLAQKIEKSLAQWPPFRFHRQTHRKP